MDSKADTSIRSAIAQTRLVELLYLGKKRIVEPHDYGIHKGVVKLLAYQVGGSSGGKLPNWRWLEADKISDVHILNRTFAGGRPAPSGKHHEWDEVFVRVRPSPGL